MTKRPWSRLGVPLVVSLTLGLAPFAPEPHVVEKLRWLFRGAEGMRPVDWFDLAFHGAPWVWLLATLVIVLRAPPRTPKGEDAG